MSEFDIFRRADAATPATSEFDIFKRATPEVSTATAVGRGAAQGATLGFSDEMRGLVEAGGAAPDEPASLGALVRGGINLLTGSGQEGYKAGVDRSRKELADAREQAPIATTVGELGGGVATGLGLAGGGLSLGANAAKAGHGLLRTAIGSAADGAALGAIQGAGSAEEGERLAGAGTGAVGGAVVGGAAPIAITGASNIVRRSVSPFAITPERQAAAAVLEREGVPLSAGQVTGSRSLRYAESELGGRTTADLVERQGEAFTDAAMKRAGGSGLATSDNLKTLNDRIGQEFKAISARNTMVADRQFGQDIGATLNRYDKLLETQQKPIINGLADDLVERIRSSGGTLPGTEYQSIRSDLSQAAHSTTNQTLAAAFRGLRNALDDTMERSIKAANPGDVGMWSLLRRQYSNMKTLERAAVGGGEDAGLGVISPARLRMAASTGNRGGYARGESDFAELAKAGQAIMTPLPQSGTAPRLRAQNLASMIPTIVGGGAGAGFGGPVGAMAGAAAGAALPKVVGMLMTSRPGQAYLSNQLLAGQMSPEMRALISQLVTSGAVATRD